MNDDNEMRFDPPLAMLQKESEGENDGAQPMNRIVRKLVV